MKEDEDMVLTIFRQISHFLPWIILNLIFFFFLIRNHKKIQGKFYTGLFYITVVLSFLAHLLQCYIQYSLSNNGYEETKYLIQWSNFTNPSFLFLSIGVISVLIEEKVSVGYKESVWLLFFLITFSCGFYAIYWHLKRNIQFTSSRFAKITFAFLCYFFYLYFAMIFINKETFSELIFNYELSGLILLLVIYLGFLVSVTASIFIIRNGIIREGMECDFLATLFFGPLYLQYKINQLADFRARWPQSGTSSSEVIE
jgi:hypothetical protein